MSCIGWPRDADPELHDLCCKKLLEPGWAGDISDTEAEYIAEQLTKSAKLRQAWGVRQFFGRRWKHISPDMAKRLCAAWAQSATSGVKGLSVASHEKTAEEKDSKGQEGQLVLPIQ